MFNESTLENAIMELFENEIHYTHRLGEQLHKNLSEVLLLEDVEAYLRAAYPDITDGEVERAILILKTPVSGSLYDENRRVFGMIVDGFPLKRDDATQPSLWIRPINFDNPESNDFKIVNQVEIVEVCNRRPDAIVYVNGLPLVVMEFKTAVKENCTIVDAYRQLTDRYRRDIPSLFRYNAFVVISDGAQNKFGTLFTPYEYFYAWNRVEPEDKPSDGLNSLFTMIRGLFRKERLLEVIHDFVYFPDSSTKEEKIVCRYPQYFAASLLYNNILKHKEIGDGKGGTYFGATGCGKSLAMLFLTRMLMRSSKLGSPTILLITDRSDLDDQLSSQFIRAKHFIGDETIEQIESREELKVKLRGRASGGVFLTTIQKFSEDINLLSDRKNIICISDEAHRTQTNINESTKISFGENGTATAIKKTYGFAQYLHQSLPNAIYVGFTGTPIDATIEVFGGVIDKYTMVDSVMDGITVSIVYEGRAAKVFADNDKLQEIDKYYEECEKQGSEVEQINASKQQTATMEAIIGDPKRLQAVAEDLVQHYEQRIDEGATVCGKAMVVCTSREIAFELYQRIVALRPEWKKKLANSPDAVLTDSDKKTLLPMERIKMVMTGNKDDKEELAKLLGTKADRQEWARQFKEPHSNFKIVIVVDMWLTGFDVPCLDTMYIDKPIQRHTLIQTISRVNRVCPGKEKGLVVDYLGIKKRMNMALKQYSGTRGGNAQEVYEDDPTEGIEELVKIVKDEMESLQSIMHGYDYSGFFSTSSLEQLQALNNASDYITSAEDRKKLYMAHAKRLNQAFKMCSSSELITKKERGLILFFSAVRAVIFKSTHGEAPDVEEMNIHVRKLMQAALESSGVEEVVKIVENRHGDLDLFDPAHLERIDQIKLPNIRLKLLERLLRQQIIDLGKINKVKAVEFIERLNNLIKEYNDRSDDAVFASEVMKAVTKGIKDMMQDVANEKNNLPEGIENYEEKAFFDILKMVSDSMKFNYPEDEMISISKEIKEMIASKSQYTDCFKRADIMAEMQFDIIIILAKHKYPPVGENYDEVYKKVLEQAENFKKYQIEDSSSIRAANNLKLSYTIAEDNVEMAAENDD